MVADLNMDSKKILLDKGIIPGRRLESLVSSSNQSGSRGQVSGSGGVQKTLDVMID